MTVLVLFLMGGEVLRAFSFAMVVGVVVGTYSSFGIAAPIVVFWNKVGTGVGQGNPVGTSGPRADPQPTSAWWQPQGGRACLINSLYPGRCRRRTSPGRWPFRRSFSFSLLGVMILIPLIYTEALPKGMLNTFLVAPAAASARLLLPQPVVKVVKAPKIINIQKMVAPTRDPEEYCRVKDEAPDVGANAAGWRRRRHRRRAGRPHRQRSCSAASAEAGSRRVSVWEAAWKRLLSSTRLRRIYPPIAKTAHVSGYCRSARGHRQGWLDSGACSMFPGLRC